MTLVTVFQQVSGMDVFWHFLYSSTENVDRTWCGGDDCYERDRTFEHHQDLGMWCQRQNVGRTERGRRRVRKVQIIYENRAPAGGCVLADALLWKKPITLRMLRQRCRPAAIDLPVQQRERENVHDPYRNTWSEKLIAANLSCPPHHRAKQTRQSNDRRGLRNCAEKESGDSFDAQPSHLCVGQAESSHRYQQGDHADIRNPNRKHSDAPG